MFLDFKMKEMESFDITQSTQLGINERHDVIGNGECVLIHSIKYSESIAFRRNCLKASATSIDEANFISNRLCKFSTMETSYHIVSCECIRDTAFVIPYGYKRNEEFYLPGCATEVFVLKRYKYWHKLFVDYDDTNLINEGNRRCDNDIDSSDECYPFET